jgi:hypothetical protein
MCTIDVDNIEVGLVASGIRGYTIEWEKIGWGDVECADAGPALAFVAWLCRLTECKIQD